jgi:glycosyltransferase involved in cell wall biosynthesis
MVFSSGFSKRSDRAAAAQDNSDGAAERQSDMAGFDAQYYLDAYPDVRLAGAEPLKHYQRSGWREGRNPSADFDTVFYRMTVSALVAPDLCPLVHYNRHGQAANAPRSAEEALINGPYQPAAAAVMAANPGLAQLFDADGYLERYPDARRPDMQPLEHYLTIGWREGRNPAEGFETAFYRERFMRGDAADICPLLHYHLFGRAAALPRSRAEARMRARAIAAGQNDPSLKLLPDLGGEARAALVAPYFDRRHYRAIYPDVARASVDPYWHYLGSGWREGRSAGPLFDPQHYLKAFPALAETTLPPLLHYATVGRITGTAGSQFETARAMERTAAVLSDERILDLLMQLGFDATMTEFERIRQVVLPMFSAPNYRRERDLGPDVSDSEAFLRYLALDFPSGMPPGPLFSTAHYQTEISRLGLAPLKPQDRPFHHWLKYGYAAGAGPSAGFVPKDYLALNPDLAGYPDALFGHFIRHGQFEGRRFSRMTSVAESHLAALSGDRVKRSVRYLEQIARAGADSSFAAMQDFLASGRLAKTIEETALHEPEIGSLEGHVNSMIAPWHDADWAEYEQILRLLPEGPFDAVVLMPFCKLGGADFVAGVLTTTLAEAGRRVLVLRTEAGDWARPDWFPAGVASVDLSAHLNAMHMPVRLRMFYELLVHLRAADVYNVNSRLAFETFERFGERLALSTRLNAYYFCADRTPEGIEAGYPVWYFSNILTHLTAALVDNAALAAQLTERFSLTGEWRDRVRLIYTPAMTPVPAEPVADRQVASAARRSRRRILWAGRLDAQKRFDLVQDIARRLPDVDFDCWGKAVLDAPPDLSRLPENLRLHPPFKSYDDLPLAEADGWLYTSGWDGMPTILIELAALGLPIVASAVGGVPELIDDSTGWPLGETATAADFAEAIEAMLAAPDQRRQRARALQDRVRQQHSRAAYAATLAEAGKGG